jgi:hypothetical protein
VPLIMAQNWPWGGPGEGPQTDAQGAEFASRESWPAPS